jgi:hypothetical protein
MQFSKVYTSTDRQESIYQYVPFDVPAGAEGITLRMRHNGFLSVIDLGLFDPIGFRGFSGSERDHVVLTENDATPGYLPGKIRAGTWFVSLGLHRLDRDGVTVEVEVEIGKPVFPDYSSPITSPNRPPRRKLEARNGHRWFPSDFHTHSVHSDGDLTLNELASLAANRGLELLAITDHNTTSHHRFLSEVSRFADINLIAGQEVTTDSGHANSFGHSEWVDYREATDRWLNDTKKYGGLLSINHPLSAPCNWRRDTPEGIDMTELWHSSWDRKSDEPFQWWSENGSKIPIGGSDFHRFTSDGLPGEPTTWVEIDTEDNEVTQEQVLAALSQGRVAISADPNSAVVFALEDEMAVDGGDGLTLIMPSGKRELITKDFVTVSGESGLYSLRDSNDIYHAIGYRN